LAGALWARNLILDIFLKNGRAECQQRIHFFARTTLLEKCAKSMRLLYTLATLGLLFGAVLYPTVSQATHVRAGEITTKRISATSLTYEITLTAYYDYVTGRPAADQANDYLICFGDGTSSRVSRLPPRFINGRTSTINVYRVIHTFPAAAPYTISATIVNRNRDTKNLPPAGSSDQISFFVSTTILINAQLGLNSTPVLLNPPLDSARVGQRFVHNPAAFDADGDSLAFRLSVPKQGLAEDCPRSRNIPSYLDPTQFSRTSEAGGAPTFSINSRTGELSWDAPGEEGQFNFAFIVEEWRNGVLIGEVTRDMQIIVVDQPNRQPILAPIPPICVEAGTLIRQAVTATDPDGNRVIINGFGGVFNVGQDGQPLSAGELIQPEYARLANGGIAINQPGTATFTWQTNCNHIRTSPYDVIFKANDVPARGVTSLVAFQTFSIRIIGPSIKGLQARATASAGNRAVQLNWTPYTCAPRYGSDTTRLVIYRKEGCEAIVTPTCTTGPPAGYQRVGTTSATATTFTDTTALRRGGSYSYILVAEYPDRNGGYNGGASVPSSLACIELPLLAPVLTKVTVDSTGPDGTRRGQITVNWTRPIGLNPADLGGPYQYRLQRATGLAGENWTTVTTINTTLQAGAPDTLYVDRGASTTALNTVTDAYRYRIQFFYTGANGQLTQLADVADPASSVRLAATPTQGRVTLSWQANTPWVNGPNRVHDVFRSRTGPAGPFNQIAEVTVTGTQAFTYVDSGNDLVVRDGNTSRVLSADSSYCYRVMTRGQYADTQLSRLGVLMNYSQVICAQPTDTTRPCPPRLGLDSLNCASLTNESFCDQTAFTNRLRWQPTTGPTCDPNIASYRIYYARYEQDSLRALTSVQAPTLTFDHGGLTTVAGCYYVTAVSQRGLESAPSNRVCNDACPALVLPNVFTPNGDGKNDVFSPMRCPRFVEQIQFTVYNRWGTKVYEGTGPTLAWNGKTQEGVDLPGGQYYYQASIRYAVLNRNAPPQIIKGWVQIIRDAMSMR
jgi:gliding motility-associated-like protein